MTCRKRPQIALQNMPFALSEILDGGKSGMPGMTHSTTRHRRHVTKLLAGTPNLHLSACLLKNLSMTMATAPSPVTLQAVPKLSIAI